MSQTNRSGLEPLRHIAELARSRVGARAQRRDDLDALSELQARKLDLPAGLQVRWLGVSGYEITYEGQTLLIDPYLSRVPFSSLLRRKPATGDTATIDRYLSDTASVVGVLVGHTHFDHAIDAPLISKRFGCKAYGSRSLVNLMGLHGLSSQAVCVDSYAHYELGPFTVSFTPSLHSKLLLGMAVPYDGELSCEHLDSLCPSAYRCGDVWGIRVEVAGVSFYHQGSANVIEDAIREREVDVFLAGIAGRSFTRDYWKRILPALQPHVVVPTHYDNFFASLEEPMRFVSNIKLSELDREISAVSRDFQLLALPRL